MCARSSQPPESEARSPAGDRALARRLARLLQSTLTAGLALIVVGSALEISKAGHLAHRTVPLGNLAFGLVHFQGGALLTSGLIVLLIAPAIGLAYLAAAMFVARDRLHAAIAAVVLAILIGSMFVKGVL